MHGLTIAGNSSFKSFLVWCLDIFLNPMAPKFISNDEKKNVTYIFAFK